jgi:hypothetical protein
VLNSKCERDGSNYRKSFKIHLGFLTWQLSTSQPFKTVKIEVQPSRNAQKYFKISVAKVIFDGHLDVASVADGQPVE